MHIRTELGLFTSIVVLSSVATVAALSYRMQSELIDRNTAVRRAGEESGFAEVCRLSATRHNPSFMKNYIRYIRTLQDANQDIAFAYFIDHDRRIWFHTNPSFDQQPFSKWDEHRPRDVQELFTPIVDNGYRHGTAVIGFSNAWPQLLKRQIMDRILIRVTKASAVVVLIGILVAIFFSEYLTRPLQSIMEGCENIRKGDFSAQVQVMRKNELGELAEHFNQMASRLAILDELKDQIISNVSHDLRGPLHAIKINTEYLLFEDPNKDEIPKRYRDSLATIMQGAVRLSHYVANILNAAKIKAGRMEYRLQPTDVKTVAQNVVSIFDIMAKKRGVALEMDIPSPPPLIRVDPDIFEQALTNLVSNALKFTPPDGRITLGTQTTGDRVHIYVADTGSGISPEELPQLFSRFRQADAAQQRAKHIQGTGLGLHIVKQTVDAMGGSVAMESEVGKGTKVTLTLPAANFSGT